MSVFEKLFTGLARRIIMGKWTRRAFLTAGSLVGGGLVLGLAGIAFAPNRFTVIEEDDKQASRINTWLKITPENKIIVAIPHCEMGQGAQMGLAMMLAEELEASWQDVQFEEAPAKDIYANGHLISGMLKQFAEIPPWLERSLEYTTYRVSRIVQLQTTGGSSSTITTGQYGMRTAGAAAKMMLLEAAADKWNVNINELTAAQTRISHNSTDQSATYGELASYAAELEPPVNPPMKDPDTYSLVGTPQDRPDFPSKITGNNVYAVDINLPNMLYATITASPVPGGKLESVDTTKALEMPGVKQIIELDNAVVAIANGYWQALQAVRALDPVYTNDGKAEVTTTSYYAEHSAVLDAAQGDVDFETGNTTAAFESATKKVEVEYLLPYLAHATMEPMAATAKLENGKLEVWAASQDPLAARYSAANVINMDTEDVIFHNLDSGGSFGRRLPGAFDYIEQAVLIAQQTSPQPVKLIWSREEDIQHDFYRPAMMARFKGGVDDTGATNCWICSYTGPSEMGAARPIYGIPNQQIITNNEPEHLRHGSWRSVGFSLHGFLMESFVDELAVAADSDPYTFRHKLLAEKPRHLAVLERVASMSNWNSTLAPGHGLGIAIVESFFSIVAEVAEVSISDEGTIKVHNVYAAVDCGQVVNPNQAEAQIQGGILFGLSAALYQEITLENGAVQQTGFTDYSMVKLADAPRIHVEFINSKGSMGGLGEPSVPPIAPAVANGIFSVTAKRLRSLPLRINA